MQALLFYIRGRSGSVGRGGLCTIEGGRRDAGTRQGIKRVYRTARGRRQIEKSSSLVCVWHGSSTWPIRKVGTDRREVGLVHGFLFFVSEVSPSFAKVVSDQCLL